MAAPIIALAAHFALPKAARRAFRTTGLRCAGLTVLLWGATCGISGHLGKPSHVLTRSTPSS
jgi:hypothetical protein